jgi:hypothetical protein
MHMGTGVERTSSHALNSLPPFAGKLATITVRSRDSGPTTTGFSTRRDSECVLPGIVVFPGIFKVSEMLD